MSPQIVDVAALPGYKLRVRFKGNRARLFDLTLYLNKGIFKELKNENYFKKVRPVWGGVEWPNQQDLSAETLYALGVPEQRTYKSQRIPHRRLRRQNAQRR